MWKEKKKLLKILFWNWLKSLPWVYLFCYADVSNILKKTQNLIHGESAPAQPVNNGIITNYNNIASFLTELKAFILGTNSYLRRKARILWWSSKTFENEHWSNINRNSNLLTIWWARRWRKVRSSIRGNGEIIRGDIYYS